VILKGALDIRVVLLKILNVNDDEGLSLLPFAKYIVLSWSEAQHVPFFQLEFNDVS